VLPWFGSTPAPVDLHKRVPASELPAGSHRTMSLGSLGRTTTGRGVSPFPLRGKMTTAVSQGLRTRRPSHGRWVIGGGVRTHERPVLWAPFGAALDLSASSSGSTLRPTQSRPIVKIQFAGTNPACIKAQFHIRSSCLEAAGCPSHLQIWRSALLGKHVGRATGDSNPAFVPLRL
jgi:hypothetical protein